MRITDKALDEFIEIYRDEFGEELNRNKASEMASRLVKLYEALSRRLPDDVYLQSLDLPQRIGFRV